MDKRAVRKQILQIRDRLLPEEIKDKSSSIGRNLMSLPAYQNARTMMFFISFGSEVYTRSMVEESIKQGIQTLAPKAVPETRELIPSKIIDWDGDLKPGAYGIPEPRAETLRPVDPAAIDLLIVPGVAFDLEGNRLGYGGGYYDRFFPLLRSKVPLVALAFELQILPQVPMEKWDRKVDYIITENRIIHIKS
ncbi:MAG TPA: 5-formyltetrahydrofolate cyclo-ligase [Candidatus Limnocylindrales bacterium]|nr:5-formyltetrahydrofolate cyclo-ligase [Candidatus Limnocylindrales bacterium]